MRFNQELAIRLSEDQTGLTNIGKILWPIPSLSIVTLLLCVKTEKLNFHKRKMSTPQGVMLMLVWLFWFIAFAAYQKSDIDNLPYLSFLNPITLLCAWFSGVWLKIRQNIEKQKERYFWLTIAGLVALTALNFDLLRSFSHYAPMKYNLVFLLIDSRVQAGFSILWTCIGMVGMFWASKKKLRPIWLVSASLIAIVVLKLAMIDLQATNSIGRIISFIVVGSSLVALGYFSTIPKQELEESITS
ncbi:MAG: DUF2339 domain-containing protein [Lentisphaeria bacterium]|nr:DUF2339 domain-containing protein [Lentisphaeria bacterium]